MVENVLKGSIRHRFNLELIPGRSNLRTLLEFCKFICSGMTAHYFLNGRVSGSNKVIRSMYSGYIDSMAQSVTGWRKG